MSKGSLRHIRRGIALMLSAVLMGSSVQLPTITAFAETSGQTASGSALSGDNVSSENTDDIVGVVPGTGDTETASGSGLEPDNEPEKIIVEEIFEMSPVETSAIPMSFFTLSGGVGLKDTNKVQWIDRLDLSEDEDDVVISFYNTLVEATDNDGVEDYLIEDQYFESDNVIILETITGTIEGDYTQAEFKEELDSILNDVQTTYQAYVRAAYDAFDRDYPEVFWLSGSTFFGTPYSYRINEKSCEYEITITFPITGSLANDETFDIRDFAYRTEDDIKDAIDAMKGWRDGILDDLTSDMDVVDKIKYFNKILTTTNEYNTSGELNAIGHECRECTSALEGRTGTEGPVCEAYARAFKVLCDYVGIPCVLVDGQAKSFAGDAGESHMWNYVEVDETWYAVDVTWNDPRGLNGGATSGYETERWLLLGSETIPEGRELTFIESHPVENSASIGGVQFTNGPVLSATAYSENETGTSQTTLTVGGTPVITDDEVVNASGTGWSYDSATNTLTISGDLAANNTMSVDSAGNLNIVVTADASLAGYIGLSKGNLNLTVETGKTLSILNNDSAIVTDDGTITISGGGTVIVKATRFGVYGVDGVTIGGAKVVADGAEGIRADGGSIEIRNGATVYAVGSSGDAAIYNADGNISINGTGTTVVAGYAIGAKSAGYKPDTGAAAVTYTGIATNRNTISIDGGHLIAGGTNRALDANSTIIYGMGTKLNDTAAKMEYAAEGHQSCTPNHNGTHSFSCIAACPIASVGTVNCSGGTATCETAAVCTVCKTEYEAQKEHEVDLETGYCKYNCGNAMTVTGNGVASGAYGTKLGELTLSGLTVTFVGEMVAGNWSLTGDAVPNVGDTNTYTATFTPADTTKYSILTAQVTLQITPKTLTAADVALAEGTLTYNGQTQTKAVNAVTAGVTFKVTGNTEKNAGNYTVTVTGTGNYTGSVNLDWSIGKGAITITPDNVSAVVGGTAPETATLTYTVIGLATGESAETALSTKPTLTFSATPDMTKEGTYAINAAGAVAANYTISYGTGTLTVAKHVHEWNYASAGATITATCTGTIGNCTVTGAKQTVTLVALAGATYDGTAKAASVNGSVDGVAQPVISYTTQDGSAVSGVPTAAGTYKASISLGGKSAVVEYNIAAATLTVTGATAEGKVYNGDNSVVISGVTVSGIYGDDAVAVDATGLTGTVNSATAGTYTEVTLPVGLKLTGVDVNNYTLAAPEGAVSATVVISKAPAEAVSTDRSYLYSENHEDSVELAQLIPVLADGLSYGAVTYGVPVVTGDMFDGTPVLTGSTLSYQVKSGEVGTTGSVKVVVTTQNYEDITITVNVKRIDLIPVALKEGTTVALRSNILIEGRALSRLYFNGKAVFVAAGTDTVVKGTLAWKTPDTKPEVGNYDAEWVFTPNDATYASMEGTITITVREVSSGGSGSVAPSCSHESKELRGAYDATTDYEGYTGNLYCMNCGNLISYGSLIPKLANAPVTPEVPKYDVYLGSSKTDTPLERTMKTGETIDLNFYGLKNWKKDNYTYKWTTSDETIATVNEHGLVTMVSEGIAIIRLELLEKATGKKISVAPVEVGVPEDAYDVFLGTSKKDASLRRELSIGETVDINFYGVKGWKKENYSYEWLSSDETVAIVDENGFVTAVSEGKTVIRLKLKDMKSGEYLIVAPVVVTVPEKED